MGIWENKEKQHLYCYVKVAPQHLICPELFFPSTTNSISIFKSESIISLVSWESISFSHITNSILSLKSISNCRIPLLFINIPTAFCPITPLKPNTKLHDAKLNLEKTSFNRICEFASLKSSCAVCNFVLNIEIFVWLCLF